MKKPLPSYTFLVVIFLSSCTTIAEHFPGVYAIDVNQGNIIDQDMIDQLRPNMNKRQVLFILGSPMLVDVFHQKRWEYIYSEQKGGKGRLQRRISLFFDDEKLVSVQGDFKPSEFAVVKPSLETTVDVPKRPEDKTIFGEIGNFFTGDDIETQATSAESAADLKSPETSTPTTDIPELGMDTGLNPNAPETSATSEAALQDNEAPEPTTETPESDPDQKLNSETSGIPPL